MNTLQETIEKAKKAMEATLEKNLKNGDTSQLNNQLTSSYECEKCKDTGVIIYDLDSAAQCECVAIKARKAKIEKLTNFADIPVAFKGLTVNSFETDIYKDELTAKRIKSIAVNFVQNFKEAEKLGKGLYFYSTTPGSGKTRMAISIGNAIINLFNQSVKYMTVEQLVTEMKSSFNSREVSQKELQDAAKEVDVLILDDLGVENVSAWSESIVYSIVDFRNDAKKVTIFTSNTTVEQLPYHSRVSSRIKRMTMQVKFPEESVREKTGESEEDKFIQIMMG